MTSTKQHRRGEVLYLKHQLRMASSRLAMIHFSLNKAHDPALAAEAEGLVTQIASLQVELRELQGEAA